MQNKIEWQTNAACQGLGRQSAQKLLSRLELPIAAAFVVVTAFTPLTAHAAESKSARAPAETWICHSVGLGGAKEVWHTISGKPAGSETIARDSAERECDHAGLYGCRGGGCWQTP